MPRRRPCFPLVGRSCSIDDSIQSLSIRARQIVGAAYLECFCLHFAIDEDVVAPLIDHLWAFARARDLRTWHRQFAALHVYGQGEPLPTNLSDAIPPAIQNDFARLVDLVIDVGINGLYGPDDSIECLKFAASILQHHKISVPDASVADGSSFSNGDPWGSPVPFATLAKWEAAVRPHGR